MALTVRMAKFLAAYMQSNNATQAAKVAGYSARTAHSSGQRLLNHPEIQAVIGRSLKRAEVTIDRVIEEAARLAFLDPAQFDDETGNLLSVHHMPEDARRALAGLEVEEVFQRDAGGRYVRNGNLLKKIKFAAKTPALELLGKHLGMFPQANSPAAQALGFSIHIHLGEDEELPPGGRYPNQAIETTRNGSNS